MLLGLFTPSDYVTLTITLTGCTLDFLTGTVMGRMGCNVMFVMEPLGVNEPLGFLYNRENAIFFFDLLLLTHHCSVDTQIGNNATD